MQFNNLYQELIWGKSLSPLISRKWFNYLHTYHENFTIMRFNSTSCIYLYVAWKFHQTETKHTGTIWIVPGRLRSIFDPQHPHSTPAVGYTTRIWPKNASFGACHRKWVKWPAHPNGPLGHPSLARPRSIFNPQHARKFLTIFTINEIQLLVIYIPPKIALYINEI